MFLLLGGWWLLADLVAIALLVGLIENDHPILGSIWLFVILPAIVWWFTGGTANGTNVYSWVWQNPYEVILWAASYIGIGFLWSLTKFYFRVNSEQMQSRMRVEYDLANGNHADVQIMRNKNREKPVADFVPETLNIEAWAKDSRQNPAHPLSGENTRKILGWWSWWPVSVFSTITREFFLKLFENLFNSLKNVYVLIASAAVRRVFNPKV